MFKLKYKSDGSLERYKAHLVAKCYTQQGVDYLDTFSPVENLKTVRVILALTAIHDWSVSQMDVTNACMVIWKRYIYAFTGGVHTKTGGVFT